MSTSEAFYQMPELREPLDPKSLAFFEDVAGPLYPHSLRDTRLTAAPEEVVLDASWSMAGPPDAHVSVETASGDLLDLMRVAMGVEVRRSSGDGSGDGAGPDRARFRVSRQQQPG